MKESKFIEQMMVVGSERKFAGALIVPSFENLKVWAGQNNVSFGTVHDLIRNPAVLEMYKNIVEEYNREFNHVEQIKKFELCANEWTVDGGELTANEANLSDGSASNPGALVQSGSFTISAPDGLSSLSIGGIAVITGGVPAGFPQSITSALGNGSFTSNG